MTLDSQLERLETAQLVRRAQDPDIAYLFKHTLTQVTAYQSLLQKRRREVHRLVAEAYETAYSDGLPQIAAILAQHYAQSGDDAKTLTYAIRAGDEAARMYANAEAISNYSLALERARRIEMPLPVPLQELYLKRGRVMEVSNQFAEALANYQEMEAVGQERSDRSLVLAGLIARALLYSIATRLFDPAKGQELSDRALVLAREMADRKSEAKILWSLMLLCYFTNKIPESVRYGEQSLAIARELDLREQLAFTLSDISRSYAAAGQAERALETQTEARALWRELGNLPLLADNLTNSSGVHFNRGEIDTAFELAGEALCTARQIGNVWGEVYAEQTLGVYHLLRGDIGDSVTLAQDSVKLAEQIGALFGIPTGYAFLGWIYSMLGEPRRALEFARMAVAKGEELFRPFLPICYAALAYAYFLNGAYAEADYSVAKSHEDLDPRNFDFPQPFFVTKAEAEVAVAKGEPARALLVLDQLIANLQEFGIRVLLAESLYSKSRALQALGRVDESRAVLVEARAIAEAIGQPLSLIPILTSLSRLETDSGNMIEGQSLRLQAGRIAQEVAQKATPDLRDLFLRLPDVRFALESS